MLTQESRARIKQKEAVELEREGRYKKAASIYNIAKAIWTKIIDSNRKQSFCNARSKHCEALSLTVESDDDEDYL